MTALAAYRGKVSLSLPNIGLEESQHVVTHSRGVMTSFPPLTRWDVSMNPPTSFRNPDSY